MTKAEQIKAHNITIIYHKITFALNEERKTAIVSRSLITSGDIIIPSYVYHNKEKYSVTCIEKDAFADTDIKSIQFEYDSQIQTIEKYAFRGPKIESISIPASLTELKYGWCSETEYLTKIKVSKFNPVYKNYENKFIIGKTSKEKENFDVLNFCIRNIESTTIIKIPNFIKTIGSYSFEFCNLKSIEISKDSQLQTIEKNAFSFSTIERIEFPPSLIYLKDGWCRYLTNSIDIKLSENNPFFKNYENKFIIGKKSIENENFDVLILCIQYNEATIAIPNFIKIIGSYSFHCCNKIKRIEIPKDSKLEIIDKHAFSNTSIEYINIPHHLTRINKYAFSQCDKIKTIYIDDLSNCSLNTIEKYAFYLSSIEFLTIPSSLIDLQKGWCFEMSKIIDINVSENNPMYKIYDNKFIIGKSSIKNENFDVLVFCISNNESTTIKIPNFIKIIGSYSFNNYTKIKRIEISEDSELEIIDEYAFYNSSIEYFNIPSKLKRINKNAFNNCKQLQVFEIPINSNLQIIEKNAFASSMIKQIYIPSHVKQIEHHSFFMCDNLQKVEMAEDCELQIIEENVFNSSGIESINIPMNVTQIKGNAFSFCKKLQKVEIPKNSKLQKIEENTFSSTLIEKIFVPSHVKVIEKNAFLACNQLKVVEIPSNSELKKIEKCAFIGSAIECISIPSSLIELDDGWCFHMNELKEIKVSERNPIYKNYLNKFIIGKSSIENDNFDVLVFCIRNNESTTIKIPNFIKIIGSYSFNNFNKLKRIEIPNDSKIDTIDKFAFFSSSIECINIPSNVISINEDAFAHCKNLKVVEIPIDSNLQIIKDYAFMLSEIKSFYISAKVSQIVDTAFAFCPSIQIVEIDENSKLENIQDNIIGFHGSLIMIPLKLSRRLNI